MKKTLPSIFLCALISLSACKKSEQPLQNLNEVSSNLSATAQPPRLSVITIAGKNNVEGSADGQGDQARFDFPYGIDIGQDGNLYVADMFNNAIRKVTPAGNVSTVTISPSSDGQTLFLPIKVLVGTDGTLSVLTNWDLSTPDKHKYWIIKPTGELITPASQVNYYTYIYHDICKDPFSNYLQLSGERYVTTHRAYRQGFIESAEIVNGIMGQHPYSPPLDSLNTESREYSAMTNIYCGYNGVKYIVIRNRYVYKLTKSGVFTRIYRDINFHEIRDLVATNDSKTIYFVDRGEIVSVSNNKLTKLVGFTGSFSNPDGVGNKAYVFASHLALSKDEGTLYFTDDQTVRKLILR
ncbi:MAG: hypothetical protein JKY70_21980 [Mucilaginibacter sp.]|nr:hypothetical protein [Mucilaginibacter sp.]